MTDTKKVTRLYGYGSDHYKAGDLGVYLVWCEPKDKKQKSIIIPVLALYGGDIYSSSVNRVELPDETGEYIFSTESYIKAVAKTLSAELDSAPDDASEWKRDSYKFSTVRICLGSLNDLIDKEQKDVVDSFTTGHISFNDMVAAFFCNSGTVGVTLEAIKEASEEVEEPIGDKENTLKSVFIKQDPEMH